MTNEHTHFETWSAAYTLGALEPEERREFERHLATCDECAAAVASFAPLPGLIAQVEQADLEHRPDPVRADYIAARARREHQNLSRSRRAWRLAAVAGAAAAAVLAVVLISPLGSDNSPSQADFNVTESAADTATITALNHEWGTELNVELTGLPLRSFYQLWAIDSDGTWSTAATWKASPDGTAVVTGAIAANDAKIERIVVTSGSIDDVLVDAVVS